MKTATRSRPADDEQALKDATAEAEATLADLDRQIKQHEAVRDQAEAKMAVITTSGHGDPVAMWRLEEEQEAAQKRIAELLDERRPWADRHRRLAAVSEPLRQRDREIEQTRHAIAGMEQLVKVFPLLDEAIALIEEARPHLAESGGRASVPSSLTKLIRAWGPGGWTRHCVESQLGISGLDALRARLERLERGAIL